MTYIAKVALISETKNFMRRNIKLFSKKAKKALIQRVLKYKKMRYFR